MNVLGNLFYRKQFQKFQDKKMRINTESREVLKSAKTEGYLHEVLLDRRSKMKADRYCKWDMESFKSYGVQL